MRNSIQVITCLMIAILIASPPISTLEYSAMGLPAQTKIISALASNSSYINRDPIRIENDHDFSTQGFPGRGTKSDPYVIEGLSITTDSRYCIDISGTRAHFIIKDCYFSNIYEGISYAYTFSCITFLDIANGSVENCLIEGGSEGIYITNSRNCTISNCTILGTDNHGIEVWGSFDTAVSENKVYGCGGVGGLGQASAGISVRWSYNCTVKRNIVYQNEVGVSLGSNAENNTIIQNSIGWNRYYSAIDHGNGNIWSIGIGNSWSDYDGDGSYQIDGEANSNDSLPFLLRDVMKPIITNPKDIDYEVDETGHNITWQPRDEFSYRFIIGRNEIDYQTGLWNGLNISINVDGLSMDEYNFTLTVFDAAGNNVSDSVIVSVYIILLGGIGTELVMMASGISVLIVVATLLLVKKLR